MSSPFPGMDPYIEARNRWPDFHHEFISQCRAALNASLPENYVATINERVQTIELIDQGQRPQATLPDVSVVLDPRAEPRNAFGTSMSVATLEPTTLPQAVTWLDEPTESYIEIYQLPDHRLITGLEVLSPSNKVNPGRVAYVAKRRDLLHHGVNLVEIDLLLDGERLGMLAPLPPGDYYTFVTRAETRDHCSIYAWSIRSPLPTIRVPLGPEDRDVELDLADVFRTTYSVSRCERLLAYDRPLPRLRLGESDKRWAESVPKG